MANEIGKKAQKFTYLFDYNSYRTFKPDDYREIIKDIQEDLKPRESFFKSIQKKLENKPSFKKIKEK